jgi:hypothetical protein
MDTRELIDRAQGLCRAMRRPFPNELKAYASGWQRQGYDLPWCWARVNGALREGRAAWLIEAEVLRHHDRLQRARDAMERKAGEPLVATPTPDAVRHWGSEGHQQALPPSAATCGMPDEPNALSAERHPAPRQPYRKRTGTKAHRVREFLRAHVLRRGPTAVLKLEQIAKIDGLLAEDQTISRCSTFRRVMTELNIESHRLGYGRGASYVWRRKPPAWTRGLDVHE